MYVIRWNLNCVWSRTGFCLIANLTHSHEETRPMSELLASHSVIKPELAISSNFGVDSASCNYILIVPPDHNKHWPIPSHSQTKKIKLSVTEIDGRLHFNCDRRLRSLLRSLLHSIMTMYNVLMPYKECIGSFSSATTALNNINLHMTYRSRFRRSLDLSIAPIYIIHFMKLIGRVKAHLIAAAYRSKEPPP